MKCPLCWCIRKKEQSMMDMLLYICWSRPRCLRNNRGFMFVAQYSFHVSLLVCLYWCLYVLTPWADTANKTIYHQVCFWSAKITFQNIKRTPPSSSMSCRLDRLQSLVFSVGTPDKHTHTHTSDGVALFLLMQAFFPLSPWKVLTSAPVSNVTSQNMV